MSKERNFFNRRENPQNMKNILCILFINKVVVPDNLHTKKEFVQRQDDNTTKNIPLLTRSFVIG